MRTLRIRTFPGPFHPERADLTAARIQTCLEIEEEASAVANLFDSLPRGKFDLVHYAKRVRLVKRWRRSQCESLIEYAIRMSRDRKPIISFGDLHVFGIDRDGNIYHRRFCRDHTYSYDIRVWWPLGDLRTSYFETDLLKGYLLRDLRKRRAELSS